MSIAQASEAVSINIRAKARQRDLIDQAADRQGRSRSDFMQTGQTGFEVATMGLTYETF